MKPDALSFKKTHNGTAEVIQSLRAPPALPEDPDSIPITHMEADTLYNSISRGSDTLFWPSWVPGMHYVQIYIQNKTKQKTHPYI